LPRSTDVPEWVRSCLLRRWLTICAAGVRGLRTWPRTFWSKRFNSLRLFSCDGAYDTSPGLTLPTPSWFPTAVLLAVAVTARALAAPRKEEATFCWELDTPSSPKTHLPVGYRWQNSGCCQSVLRPQHSYIGDLVSHTNGQAHLPAGRGELQLWESLHAPPVRLYVQCTPGEATMVASKGGVARRRFGLVRYDLLLQIGPSALDGRACYVLRH
jgi:hypothetical protein